MSEPIDQQMYCIEVTAESAYLPEQSDPANQHYAFVYHIVIRNCGTVPAKLVSRHWVVTDAQANTQEVHGIGVIGEQPHLQPDEEFEYSSGIILSTPVGSMQGNYEILADDGTVFMAPIPAFSLAVPHILH
jgi:ApaG protein